MQALVPVVTEELWLIPAALLAALRDFAVDVGRPTAVLLAVLRDLSWVKRLRVDGKVIDKAAVSRLITKAVTLYNATDSIKSHATGRSADYVDKLVKKRIAEQGKSWRMSFEDIDKMLRLVIDKQPLVGGVQRSSPPFSGAPPNDGPAAASGNYWEHRRGMAGEAGSAAGGSTAGSGGGSEEERKEADEGAAGSAVGSPGPLNPAAGTVGGGNDADGDLSGDHDGSDADSARRAGNVAEDSATTGGSWGERVGGGAAGGASSAQRGPSTGEPRTLVSPMSATGHHAGGASGRSRRAALADAAVESVLPGGADFMRRLGESLADGARRFDEKQKAKRLAAVESERTKRVAVLTAAVEKNPDNETFRDMLRIAMGEPAGPSAPPQ
ncbi:hypothetical protein I4F81_007472 [Pyropia yezoensis]|uniref:Uncharacterized protein n=1 Tax=Pyropia yezoensis TaxID=2788 RepID=A0ACC3C5A4_PYRYE|nr:hypothetical protein I4F81_007472 [Neopyropia yezoensis]